MALQANDIFVVQKQAGTLAKVTASQLNVFLESTQTVVYKGKANFTIAGQDPVLGSDPVNPGDLWINDAIGSGTLAWNDLSDPLQPLPTVEPGDRAIWNGTTWDVITSSGGGGVGDLTGGTGITIDKTDPANPVLNADLATETQVGVVEIATDAEVASGAVGSDGKTLVVTAAQLAATNATISSNGNGTVTNVTGTLPIEVVNNTATPVISVQEATNASTGVVRFATDAEATAGIVTDAAVTPAQLEANVPDDLGVETITEGGADTLSGVLVIDGPTNGDVTIGIKEEVFMPYNLSILPNINDVAEDV